MDDLGFLETVDRLCQSVVIPVADTADRWFDPGFGKPFGVTDREILAAAIGVIGLDGTLVSLARIYFGSPTYSNFHAAVTGLAGNLPMF
jgi:hypothetical protein